ncbi:TonB-dependent receptor [Novosphingobium sp. MMS21-SN21R]|uniref:TonB-dependent receptor n=1 Tax=Novosphingobium sp. MMS21-SN21R TaxID=2969298 RepID=UPI002885488C|nr:TonB-dependent receptor [Novosphingobium sp. MMS21-SN21R]MDT0507020.1 TonB-dependent receptor [Novosphingobium sp. MMS21-SN21R]
MRGFKNILLVTAAILPITATSAFGQNADNETSDINEIVVTAQKKSENLQDVPIAVSAFSSDSLEKRGLNGGADLQNAIPNVSFGGTGFGRYNFQIRGIGAQILGASADTGVGIHENNIPLTVNRLAQAEFYDIERIEVLRGPQGTLYGRNATGGVVNTITATPKDTFSGEVTGEYGRFSRVKLTGYLNVPLGDTLAVRVAGSMIKRDGNVLNTGTGNMVDSRDLWSTRVSVQWKPSDRLRVRAMWEHFDQNDTTGANEKTICAPNAGPDTIGGVPTNAFTRASLSNACLNTAVNDPRNTGVPSSLTTLPGLFGYLVGTMPTNAFAGKKLSTDLHTIDASFDPYQRSKNDLVSLDIEVGLGDNLTLTSLSAYSKDKFRWLTTAFGGTATQGFANTPLTPGGIFVDPQLGQSDRFENRTLIRTSGEQYSQELRVQSDFDGRFNFNLGGIYLDYKSTNEIILLGNNVTQLALAQNFGGAGIYIDPLAEPDGTGHNYYNSNSPYHLKSAALFGEGYFQATDTLKATVGLRYTNDRKEQTSFPIVMLAPGRGFPAVTPQKVKFEELTGRFTVDWKPTEDNLLYASFARGYKGGGFNPGATLLSGVSPAYKPELVNAFELGAKNSLADGRVTLNLTGFYYDYKSYQIAKLVNQSVSNENVDATVKGIEFEGAVEPVRGLRFDTQIGYLATRIGNGSSIDLLNRTQGDPTLATVRSIDNGSFGASCVLPVAVLAGVQGAINGGFIPSEAMASLCTGPFAVPGASAGIPVQLSGKQLPNAPHWTMAFGAEYGTDIGSEWRSTLRADYYRQTSSFARIYNTGVDGIQGYDNLNLSLRVASEKNGIDVLLYARNLLSQQKATVVRFGDEATGATRLISGKERESYGIAITKRF